MIELQTTCRHYEADQKMGDYLERKIGSLDKYLPKATRGGLMAAVVLECDESQDNRRYLCEIKLQVKGERFYVKEATVNMYAAIDICEAKLKSQFHKYKSKHQPAKNRRGRLLAKLMGRAPEVEPGPTQDSV